MTGPETLLDGTYVRICYQINGVKKTAFVLVKNGAISWKPPKGVTSVYFRANDATKDGAVLVNGRPARLVPFSELETDADYVEVNGPFEAKTVKSQAFHNASGFNYEPLPADEFKLQMIEEEDVPLKLSKEFRQRLEEQKAKSLNAGKEMDHHKCSCPVLWHFFHRKARGHKRRPANF